MALTITTHQIRSADTPHTARAASQIPADRHPEVYFEAGIRSARGRVMVRPVAGYGVVAAAGPGGDEDEQA